MFRVFGFKVVGALGSRAGLSAAERVVFTGARALSSRAAAASSNSNNNNSSSSSSGGGGDGGSNDGGSPGGGEDTSRDTWIKFVGLVGALANWTLPAAAFSHIIAGEDASKIDPKMTSVLFVYSALFMRWALAISPANYPLLICHASNEIAQGTQMYRWYTSNSSASANADADADTNPPEAVVAAE